MARFTLTLTPSTTGANIAARRAAFAKDSPQFPVNPSGFVGFGILAGLAGFALFAVPKRSPGLQLATRLIMISAVSLALGCGGGSSSSEGGGGGTQPNNHTTSTTVTTSASKVASQSQVTFVATVTSSGSPTGTVQFYGSGNYLGAANLGGNTASLTTVFSTPGIYTVTGQYLGDASNTQSLSAGINQYVTGSTVATVQGQTSSLTHYANVTVTIQ